MFDAAGLVDEQQKVRTISALAIAALAEAATPYGIESFDSVLKPLWKGIRQHRGKVRYPFRKEEKIQKVTFVKFLLEVTDYLLQDQHPALSLHVATV